MIISKNKNLLLTLCSLSLPIMLQNLVTFAVSFADNIMVGSLGDLAVSGVFVANQIQLILQILIGGIEATVLILASKSFGKKDFLAVRNISQIGIISGLTLALLLFLSCLIFPKTVLSFFTNETKVIEVGREYLGILTFSFPFFALTQISISTLRSLNRTKVGFYISLVSLVVNVTLNFLLIFGKFGFPRLEVKGSAIATLMSRIIEAIIAVIVLLKSKELKTKARERVCFFKTAIPIMLGQFIWAINVFGAVAVMGRFSAEVISAVSIVNLFNNFIFIAVNGLSAGVAIFVSKSIGENKGEELKKHIRIMQIYFLLLGALSFIIVNLLKNPVISFYNISDLSAEIARRLIFILSLTLVATSYQHPVFFGLFKGSGRVWFVFLCDLLCVIFANLIPAITALKLSATPIIVFLLLKSDQIIKSAIGFFAIRKKANQYEPYS